MQSELNLKTIESLFVAGKIDYQYFQYRWFECNVEKVNAQNHGDYLDLQITGEDSLGPYSFTGQIIMQNGKPFMQCKKLYGNQINGDNFVYYDGYYNKEKNGFFGKWYFDDYEEEDDDNFFIRFQQDE